MRRSLGFSLTKFRKAIRCHSKVTKGLNQAADLRGEVTTDLKKHICT